MHSPNRIHTTHAGSLPRTPELLAANEAGDMPAEERASLQRAAVSEVVRRQHAAGIDFVNDGEYGKSMTQKMDYGAWWSYIFQRTAGLEIIDGDLGWLLDDVQSTPGNIRTTGFLHRRDRARFADAYNDPTSGVMVGKVPDPYPSVVTDLSYAGHDAVAADTANLTHALGTVGVPASDASGTRGFITSIAPGSAARLANRHYATDEQYVNAWADALAPEYRAIVDAGFMVQIDDPSMAENWDQITPEPSLEDYLAFTEVRVAALNRALEGIPAEMVRYHLCWGSWHGPHTTDLPMADIVRTMLQVNAQAFSFEAANARHAHEWRVWQDVDLPAGKVLLPGCVSHSTNVVEHPELVAERIVRFAELVGPENVVASTDCGLGGRVHADIAWAKLRALADGAEIASALLY